MEKRSEIGSTTTKKRQEEPYRQLGQACGGSSRDYEGALQHAFSTTPINMIKVGVHVKPVSMSLNTAFLPISRVMFQATLNLYVYFINYCLAVLCKCLADFLEFREN